jgi:hypothetical protein
LIWLQVWIDMKINFARKLLVDYALSRFYNQERTWIMLEVDKDLTTGPHVKTQVLILKLIP